MADPKQAVQAWYAERLRKYYTRGYRAYVLGKEKGDRHNELGRSAAYVPPEGHGGLPGEVCAAHAFYRDHFEETDLGSARVWRFAVRKKNGEAVLGRPPRAGSGPRYPGEVANSPLGAS
jgi:hypothetical protein